MKPSYEPGVVWTDLREVLPESVIATLKEAVPRINKSLPGFDLEDAVLTAAETRSSAPVRIPRDPATYECVSLKNFYPAGEGAGMPVASSQLRRMVCGWRRPCCGRGDQKAEEVV